MKNMKRLLVLILCLSICVGMLSMTASAAYTSDPSYHRDVSGYENYAQYLKELGLFKGVNDTDFALDRAPTRVEAMVMLIRMLGEEQDAKDANYSHPFTDVPQWADAYIGWAYEKGYSNGISSTKFGTGVANSQMFLTFLLRALGYTDTDQVGSKNSQLNFTYADPFTLALKVGLLNDDVNTYEFLRADAACAMAHALDCYKKDSRVKLADYLRTEKNLFTQDEANNAYKTWLSGKIKLDIGPDSVKADHDALFEELKNYIIANGSESQSGKKTYSYDYSTKVSFVYSSDDNCIKIKIYDLFTGTQISSVTFLIQPDKYTSMTTTFYYCNRNSSHSGTTVTYMNVKEISYDIDIYTPTFNSNSNYCYAYNRSVGVNSFPTPTYFYDGIAKETILNAIKSCNTAIQSVTNRKYDLTAFNFTYTG